MPTEIKMPQLGESVHEGTIGKWLKRPGDAVAKYEPLVEVNTDKVNVEMPSPFAGTLREILVEEGATVDVGTAIAVIEEARAASATGSAGGPGAATAVPPSAPPAAVDGARPRAPVSSGPGAPALRLTPLVRRLAEEHRLSTDELASISGSGEGGRITKDDVLRHIETRRAAPRPETATAAPGRAARV